jgi:SRSO17 transposase
MNRRDLRKLDRELTEFVSSMVEGMGRVERRNALSAYVSGLLLDGERKSIEPIAARLVDDPTEIQAMRQRLQQAVVVAEWADDEMFRRLALKLDGELPGVEALVVDDTGFAKKGEYSVGVARQYSGTLGRVDNCQVATSLHLAGEVGSGCIGMRLFLPERWTEDPGRREAAGVPPDVAFQKKWEIALTQIDAAIRWGVRRHVVLADAGYGDIPEFRVELRERGLRYVVGIQGDHSVWPPGVRPQAPKKPPGTPGPQRTRPVADEEPQRINAIARSLGRDAFSTVRWREGSRGRQSSRFAALWVMSAENHGQRRGRGQPPTEPVWLLIEWPDEEVEPTKFWLASLPKSASLVSLVRLAKLRWRVERDYQELKQEIGLDHYEGRTWRGFHHHATLCAVAHGFLALRRALFPPEEEVDAR